MADGWTDMQAKRANGGDPDEPVLIWHSFQGAVVIPRGRSIDNRFYTHWREIDDGAWIDKSERAPNEGDADKTNCVIARYRWGEVTMAGWWRVRDDGDFTQWQRTPEPPTVAS